jgi:hypothetical protein
MTSQSFPNSPFSSDINDILNQTKTIIYIICGPNKSRQSMVNSFLSSLNLSSSYVLYPARDKNQITEIYLQHLKKQNYFTNQWEKQYLTEVHDPKSREKNLGRLALILTIHDLFLTFYRHQKSFENLFLFEDDVMVAPKYQSNPKEFLKLLSSHLFLPASLWDLQYLGFCFECGNRSFYSEELIPLAPSPLTLETNQTTAPNPSVPDSSIGKDLFAVKAIFPLCKHAILLNRHFIRLYLQHYRPLSNNKGDWIFHQISCRFQLKVLRPLSSLFVQNISSVQTGSMLGNNNDKRDFAHWVSCRKEFDHCQELGVLESQLVNRSRGSAPVVTGKKF